MYKFFYLSILSFVVNERNDPIAKEAFDRMIISCTKKLKEDINENNNNSIRLRRNFASYGQ